MIKKSLEHFNPPLLRNKKPSFPINKILQELEINYDFKKNITLYNELELKAFMWSTIVQHNTDPIFFLARKIWTEDLLLLNTLNTFTGAKILSRYRSIERVLGFKKEENAGKILLAVLQTKMNLAVARLLQQAKWYTRCENISLALNPYYNSYNKRSHKYYGLNVPKPNTQANNLGPIETELTFSEVFNKTYKLDPSKKEELKKKVLRITDNKAKEELYKKNISDIYLIHLDPQTLQINCKFIGDVIDEFTFLSLL
jgi:hypothetical protein